MTRKTLCEITRGAIEKQYQEVIDDILTKCQKEAEQGYYLTRIPMKKSKESYHIRTYLRDIKGIRTMLWNREETPDTDLYLFDWSEKGYEL